MILIKRKLILLFFPVGYDYNSLILVPTIFLSLDYKLSYPCIIVTLTFRTGLGNASKQSI
jgi:hypothetical protein